MDGFLCGWMQFYAGKVWGMEFIKIKFMAVK